MNFEIEGLEEGFSSVTDKLKKVINKCVHTLEVNGFKLPIKEKPGLRFKLGDKASALGTAYYPRSTHNGNYLTVLSKYLEDMDEDEVQNTIYHELGHVYQMQFGILLGIVMVLINFSGNYSTRVLRWCLNRN